MRDGGVGVSGSHHLEEHPQVRPARRERKVDLIDGLCRESKNVPSVDLQMIQVWIAGPQAPQSILDRAAQAPQDIRWHVHITGVSIPAEGRPQVLTLHEIRRSGYLHGVEAKPAQLRPDHALYRAQQCRFGSVGRAQGQQAYSLHVILKVDRHKGFVTVEMSKQRRVDWIGSRDKLAVTKAVDSILRGILVRDVSTSMQRFGLLTGSCSQ